MKAIMSLRQLPGNTRTSESATLSDRRYPVMRPALPIVGMRSGSGPRFRFRALLEAAHHPSDRPHDPRHSPRRPLTRFATSARAVITPALYRTAGKCSGHNFRAGFWFVVPTGGAGSPADGDEQASPLPRPETFHTTASLPNTRPLRRP